MDIARPAILYWSSEALKNRERDVLHSRSSGGLKVRTEEKQGLHTMHVLRAAPIDKISTSINKEGRSVRLMSKKRTRRQMDSASEIVVYPVNDVERIVSMRCKPIGEATKASADKSKRDLNLVDDFVLPPNSISRKNRKTLGQEYSKIAKHNELQDPANGVTENSILSKSNKKVHVGKNYKTRSKSTKVDTIRTRQSPLQLVKVLSKLTSEQKKSLIEMGFESLIEFRIHTIPSKLAHWVVRNFDAERCKMIVGDKAKEITRECVHEILGFPIGSMEVNTVSRTGTGNKSVISEWRKQYPKPSKGTRRIYFKEVMENVKNEKEGGRLFKLNILVLIMTIMAEGIKCATVNQNFLPCIQNVDEIRHMDWCGYVLKCLKRSKISWRHDDAVCWYTGPLLFLVVWYVHNTRCKSNDMDIARPAILYWSSEALKNRERDELHSQGFGKFKDRTKENPELVHVPKATPIDKMNTSLKKEGNLVSNKCIAVSNTECVDKDDEVDTKSHIVDGTSNKGLESECDDVLETETDIEIFEDATRDEVYKYNTQCSKDVLWTPSDSKGICINTEKVSMEYTAKEYAHEIKSIFKKLHDTRLDLEDIIEKAATHCPKDEDLCKVIQWVRGDLQKSDKEECPIDVSENDDDPKV